MPRKFELDRPPAGFAGTAAREGEPVDVIYRELIPPSHARHLLERLESLNSWLFGAIPDLPSPSQIDHILVVIKKDLSGIAYVNELQVVARMEPNRPVESGELIRVSDIQDIDSVDLGVEIPDDAGFVLVRSHGWKRSLMYDFGPLLEEPVYRDYELSSALAEQTLILLGLTSPEEGAGPAAGNIRLSRMRSGLARLKELLAERVEDESEYQELLERHPWMLGGEYDLVESHRPLDDARVPDFTARRSYDQYRDVIEIKQPFQAWFKKGGELAAPFNDAWNQLQDYVSFVQRQRTYLRDEKGLRFQNPRGLLLLGYNLSDDERRRIREHEKFTNALSVRTYDELMQTAKYLVELMATADERVAQSGKAEDNNTHTS